MESVTNGKEQLLFSDCSLAYVSVGCNRYLHSLAWGQNGLIAFGACNSVAIYIQETELEAGKICQLLNQHTGKIICLDWIPSINGIEIQLASGSADKSICIWTQVKNKWELSQQLHGHGSAICAVAAINCHNEAGDGECTILASSSADSTVIIWKNHGSGKEFCQSQTLHFGNGFALSLAFSKLLCSDVPVLACGCDNTMIHLFVEKQNDFVEVQRLKGHEDWVQAIDFSFPDKEKVFLASASKDSYIRIWKIGVKKEDEGQNDELRLEEQTFSSEDKEYSIVLESVLAGHEGWVNGVNWARALSKEDGTLFQPLKIISASMDKTMMLWQFDEDAEIWMDTARMGEVGGNTLGFYGCAINPNGNSVIAHDFQGAFHLWLSSGKQESNSWEPGVTISGHFGSVQDFDWDPLRGDFLISVGTDQTARLHSTWARDGKQVTWHEIARPQVHGYDMQCISCIGRGLYASGSEEKVIRVFKAPKSFFESLSLVSKIDNSDTENSTLPLGASIPSLGLSNKAVFQGDLDSWNEENDDKSRPMKASAFASEDPAPYKPLTISCPPPEDVLLQNTLWPEVHKLYGHGFEIFCLASNPQGTVLASACKAAKSEHANILLWDTNSWKQVGNLQAHILTVTKLSFSHSGDWLLSVSRDRTWALFCKCETSDDGSPYVLVQKTDKKTSIHTRIIWSCCWTHDDKYFVTASRDKKVILWNPVEISKKNLSPASKSLDVGEPATAVSCLPYSLSNNRYVFSVGMESGQVNLYSWSSINQDWKILVNLEKSICPTLTVKMLRWKKQSSPESTKDDNYFYLAACSSDNSLRIIRVPRASIDHHAVSC